MKIVKKVFVILLLFIILFNPLIMIVNNFIALNMKNELIEITETEKIEVIDSFSRAGKYFGNGNGMEYRGIVIINSDLSISELENIYSKYEYKDEWESIVVRTVNKESIDYLKRLGYNKQNLSDKVYIVSRTEYAPMVNKDYLQTILDFDIRGH